MASTSAELTAQLQCLQAGGPFKTVNVPKPQLASDEVLIRQRIIALNLLDVKQRDLGLFVQQWPYVLGTEGAGVVEAVGSAVKHLQVADEVAAWEAPSGQEKAQGGAFQEHVVVPAHWVLKKPRNISLEEAASLPICFMTAVCAIAKVLKIPLPFLHRPWSEGEAPSSVLILGGSSVTGAAAIQLLRKGYPSLTILTTSSEKHESRLKELGATHVSDYRSSSVVADLMANSPRAKGVDVIIDCVGAGASQTDICDVFDPDGSKRYAFVITGAQIPVPDDVTKLGVNAYEMISDKQLLPSLTELVEKGIYRVPLPVRIVGQGLEQLPTAMDEVRKASGEKLLVTL